MRLWFSAQAHQLTGALRGALGSYTDAKPSTTHASPLAICSLKNVLLVFSSVCSILKPVTSWLVMAAKGGRFFSKSSCNFSTIARDPGAAWCDEISVDWGNVSNS